MTLQEAIEELARVRLIREARTQKVKELEDHAKTTPIGQAIAQAHGDLAVVRDMVNLQEEFVREAALTEYARTGDVRPGPGILIKRFESLEYEPGKAKAWCIQNYPNSLRYDARMFEKAARVFKPEFVSIVETMRPTIARDLSTYAGEQDAT